MTEATVTYDNQHVGAIIDGQKTLTARPKFKDKWENLEAGDEVEFVTEGGKVFATAVIDKISVMTGIEFVNKRLSGHRTYGNPSQFINEMAGYYPDREINKRDNFYVIWFRNVKMAS